VKSPASLNVISWKPPFAAMSPVSQRPLSSVAVWMVAAAVFVQQTVSPGLIVTSLGVNEKFAIVTIVSPAGQPPVGFAEAWLNAGSTPKKSAATAPTSASTPSESPLLIPRGNHKHFGHEFQIVSGAGPC
jgi:hypothetical protein